jgi:hypothetical protein
LAQTENLKAAGVGEHRARPADEPMQPAHAADCFMSWPQIKVIGVAENDFSAQAFQHILSNGLDTSGSSNGHEDRRLDRPVRKDELRAPSACFGLVE